MKSDISPEILAMMAEAEKWAQDAKQCKCCQAWALLDEFGHCASCPTSAHNHPEIVIKLAK